MGKLNKRFNEKARQGSKLDQSQERKKNEELEQSLNLGSSELDYKSVHDTSNAFVTQSRKKKTNKKEFKESKVKVLSRKQKKKLECLHARKQKEKKRVDVLKSLKEYQLTAEQLSQYKSSTSIGQVDKKRKTCENIAGDDDASSQHSFKAKRKKKKNCNDDMDILSDGIPLVQIDTGSKDNDSLSDGDSDDENYIQKCDKEDHKEDICCDNDNEPVEQQPIVEIAENKDAINVDVEAQLEDGSSEANEAEANEESENPKKEPIMVTPSEPVKPIYVGVERKSEMQAARLLLPILPEEQVIMETVQENDVIIICGSTGSGKTTQVPQFLFEAGYGTHESRNGIIGVTEPRRVAAMSMSKRVAEEMSLSQDVVSFQIRFEGNTTDKTKIKFMTDGVLLKEMETDFLLSKYSVIIIDEAHERSVYTDILIGMLTRIVPLRNKRGNKLKLIIMSATLKIDEFTENKLLFQKPPPVLKVDSRQYPVTIHFNRKTCEDYVSEAFKKVCKIHQSFKVDGGILVFLTGQREVLSLCSKLRKAFPNKGYQSCLISSSDGKEEDGEPGFLPKIDLSKYAAFCESPTELEHDDDGETCSSGDEACLMEDKSDEILPTINDYAPLHILPLYSLLPTNEQSKVFLDVPEGHRLCIISTNVAETSLTLPGIKYIVDTGKVKTKFFDKVTGVSTFRITWTSKASANQRAGRAGRVGPGHCYRLYSSAVFENSFDDFSEPEIKRRPVDDLVLQMKNMCIDVVCNFPFPSPPDKNALKSAEELLLQLGALKNTKTKQGQEVATISPLGKSLSKIPISPRFAKMIYLGGKKGCAQYVIAIASALTVRDIFTNDIDLSNIIDVDDADDDARKKKMLITKARRKWAGDGPLSALGDIMVILRAVGAFEHANCSQKFCEDNGLRFKAMLEIKKLRIQLKKALDNVTCTEDICEDVKIKPPTSGEASVIRQIILSCLGDHVARKIPPEHAKSLKVKNAYQCCLTDDPVYIHPTSSLFTKLPEYVVYHEMCETSKLYMKTLFIIDEGWLPVYAPHKCHLGKPLDEPLPCFDTEKGQVQCYISSTFGHHMWPLSAQLLPYPDCTEKYRWFTKFFLDGEVCEKLKQFSSHLVTPSLVMLKTWSHLQQKTEDLLCCFMERGVNDRSKLLHEWEKNPNYILFQYLKWLPDSQHTIVKSLWPPI